MTAVHQQGIVRLDTDEYRDAIVTKVNGDGTVTLVGLSNGANWGDGHAAAQGTIVYTNIAVGTGIGEWQPGTYLDGELAACCAVPAAGGAPSITIGVDFQATAPSRPARFVISGKWTGVAPASGTVSGTIELHAGPSANPSTKVDDQQLSIGSTLVLGLALTLGIPWKLDYELPAGHYGRVVPAAGSGFAITSPICFTRTAFARD